jgi:enoyl-CoA hydratase
VLIMTLNRPQAKNAVNQALADQLGAALEELDRDPELRAGIITGAGGSFCAGMDLKAFVAGERAMVPGRGFAGITERSPEKPVIAAVEGFALAGGCEIAVACDLIVAARDATFGIPEVKHSLVAVGGGLIRLPKRIPYHVAMELALTGRGITAARAAELGLVNRVTEPGAALDGAVELAEQIEVNAPLAVRATKAIVRQTSDWSEAQAFDEQEQIAGPVLASADAQEGARAFAEKRKPVWKGA